MQGEAGVSGSPGPTVRDKQAVLLCSWSLDASNTTSYWLVYGHLTVSPRRETSTSLLPALPLTRRCLTPSCIITLH